MEAEESRYYVALDLETTGLMAETDRIVEIGAVRFEASGREVGRFERLVDPGRPMSPAAEAVHGITDLCLAGAPPASAVLPEFLEFLGPPDSTTLLAHNAAFDAGFLGRELGRLGRQAPSYRVVDTLALARSRIPEARDHRLDTLARMLNLNPDGAHRALADSLRVKGLWLALDGDRTPPDARVAYPIYDPLRSTPVPEGWDRLSKAIAAGSRVRIIYSGGSRGECPRDITPRRYALRGGTAYLVAFCHLDDFEKSFRLDRVRHYEVIPHSVDALATSPERG